MKQRSLTQVRSTTITLPDLTGFMSNQGKRFVIYTKDC
jgi:hypothetical protein